MRRVPTPEQQAWSIRDWGAAVSISKASVYRLIARGDVKVVKIGAATRVITAPREYLRALEAETASRRR